MNDQKDRPISGERVIFAHTVDGLFNRALKGDVTEGLKEELKAEGLDLNVKLMPGYRVVQWARIIAVTAKEVYPNMDPFRGQQLLGERLAIGYGETFIGKAVLPLIRLLGPKKTLSRTRQNFRSGNNYTEATFTDTGDKSAEVWMNDDVGLHAFTRGVMRGGLVLIGTKNPVVETLKSDSNSITFKVRWD